MVQYTNKTDIWSLGVSVFELLCGHGPFEVEDPELTQALILFGEVETWPEHLSIEARDFLRLCLQKDPMMRPSCDELLLHPLVLKHIFTPGGALHDKVPLAKALERNPLFQVMREQHKRYLKEGTAKMRKAEARASRGGWLSVRLCFGAPGPRGEVLDQTLGPPRAVESAA